MAPPRAPEKPGHGGVCIARPGPLIGAVKNRNKQASILGFGTMKISNKALAIALAVIAIVMYVSIFVKLS